MSEYNVNPLVLLNAYLPQVIFRACYGKHTTFCVLDIIAIQQSHDPIQRKSLAERLPKAYNIFSGIDRK